MFPFFGRRFAVVYDTAEYSREGLISPDLAKFQGRALYVYNSGEFSEKDFLSISSVGKSQKLEDAKSIGKYGLGFNTCYHMSDVVSFTSSEQLIIFDPHGKSLPNKQLGLRCRYTDPDFKHHYPGHVEAFNGVSEGPVSRGRGFNPSPNLPLIVRSPT